MAWEAPKAGRASERELDAQGDLQDSEPRAIARMPSSRSRLRRAASRQTSSDGPASLATHNPRSKQRSPNGLRCPWSSCEGRSRVAWDDGRLEPPKEKYMLLGAVVDGGDRQHFFKMTGPEKTVSAAKKDFDAFVATFHSK